MNRQVRTVLLVNPNSSATTTAAMAAVARRTLGPAHRVHAVTAGRGPALITTGDELRASAADVLAAVREATGPTDAVVVAAFGDPAVDELRHITDVPTVGIAEAAIREAAAGGRRFGIATTTPGLVESIDARVTALGLRGGFRGIRLTSGDPRATVDDPGLLDIRLVAAVQDCVRRDGAECVVVGGGPLATAVDRVRARVAVPLVAPVPAACRAVSRRVSRPRGSTV